MDCGLTALAEDIPKQPSIDYVVSLSVFTLTMICNEKEQVEQGKIQNAQFKEKWGTRKWNGAKSCVQEDKQIKEKLVSWNKGYGDLWAKPHPATLPTCEKELKKSLGLDVVMHTFDPSNLKVELEACLVYRQGRKAWRTESW